MNTPVTSDMNGFLTDPKEVLVNAKPIAPIEGIPAWRDGRTLYVAERRALNALGIADAMELDKFFVARDESGRERLVTPARDIIDLLPTWNEPVLWERHHRDDRDRKVRVTRIISALKAADRQPETRRLLETLEGNCEFEEGALIEDVEDVVLALVQTKEDAKRMASALVVELMGTTARKKPMDLAISFLDEMNAESFFEAKVLARLLVRACPRGHARLALDAVLAWLERGTFKVIVDEVKHFPDANVADFVTALDAARNSKASEPGPEAA